MLCLRCSRGLGAIAKTSTVSQTLRSASFQPSKRYVICLLFSKSTFKRMTYRTFTSITPRRPVLSSTSFNPTFSNASIPEPSAAVAPLDLMPKISVHPALEAMQVRCGPRNTFDPSHFVRKRRHGFLSRLRTRKGRNTLQRRRSKKRSTLSH